MATVYMRAMIFPANRFVIEYMGEIIDNAKFEKGFRKTENENYYIFAIKTNKFIGSIEFGNESRFANH